MWSPPAHELRRSPAAIAIGALADQSGLFLSHFEHRRFLPWPAAWEPDGRPDLGEVAGWSGGVLPETKFRHFQLDRRVGSFHPGQQPRWSAHELCHGLVGYAWAPGKSRFWHAQAARLAELLPVALWYFYDVAGAYRCPQHAEAGALFAQLCPDCEAGAQQGPVDDPRAAALQAQGRAFVEQELAAIARSRRLGLPLSTRFGSIDLMSDALASVAAHGARLQSPTFARYVERFAPVGRFDRLEELEERVLALTAMVEGGPAAAPWPAAPLRWAIEDLGWRLLLLREDTEGEPQEALLGLVDALAAAPVGPAAVEAAAAGYTALCEDWELPDPDAVFAVGYPLPGGHGIDRDQLQAGVESALPNTARHLGKALPAHIAAFAAGDGLVRSPIGRRFARYLAAAEPGPKAELAALEAAVTHAAPADLGAASLREPRTGGPCRRSPGVERLRLSINPAAALEGKAPRARKTPEEVAVTRLGGEVTALTLPADWAAALDALDQDPRALEGLPPAAQAELLTLGLALPLRYDEDAVDLPAERV